MYMELCETKSEDNFFFSENSISQVSENQLMIETITFPKASVKNLFSLDKQ